MPRLNPTRLGNGNILGTISLPLLGSVFLFVPGRDALPACRVTAQTTGKESKRGFMEETSPIRDSRTALSTARCAQQQPMAE